MSQRLTLTVVCPMSLRLFPMDVHICTLDIESYGYTSEDVYLSWHGRGRDTLGGVTVGGNNKLYFPQFRLLWYPPYNTTAHMTSGMTVGSLRSAIQEGQLHFISLHFTLQKLALYVSTRSEIKRSEVAGK